MRQQRNRGQLSTTVEQSTVLIVHESYVSFAALSNVKNVKGVGILK